jgi:hypothetical protein
VKPKPASTSLRGLTKSGSRQQLRFPLQRQHLRHPLFFVVTLRQVPDCRTNGVPVPGIKRIRKQRIPPPQQQSLQPLKLISEQLLRQKCCHPPTCVRWSYRTVIIPEAVSYPDWGR